MATSRMSLLLETNDVERAANAIGRMATVKMAPAVRDGTLKLLDTFDWLLDRSNITLQLHETESNTQLILSGPKYSLFSEVPFADIRWVNPADFGHPFLDRQLSRVTSNRALIVQAATSALSYNFKFYNAEEMDVAAAWLYHLPEINQCSVLLVTKRSSASFGLFSSCVSTSVFKFSKSRIGEVELMNSLSSDRSQAVSIGANNELRDLIKDEVRLIATRKSWRNSGSGCSFSHAAFCRALSSSPASA